MSTVQTASNKAAIMRFHGASNTGDLEQISETIDELVEPNALIHTPLPIEATGAQALKVVFASLLRGFPDLQVVIEDLIERGRQGRQPQHGYGDPAGRLHGPLPNRQTGQVQRDLHLPLRRRPNR